MVAQWREFRSRFGDNIAARLHAQDIAARDHWMAEAKRNVDPRKARTEILKAIVPAYFFDCAKGLALAATFPDGILNPDASDLLNQDLTKNYDVRAGLRKLSRPVLILHGHQDPMGDKTAENIKALLPSATLRYFHKCGHFPWIERPEEMQTVLAAFLSQKRSSDEKRADMQ